MIRPNPSSDESPQLAASPPETEDSKRWRHLTSESAVGKYDFLVGIAAAMSSMIVLQTGAALSKPAMETHGSLEITWLRLMWAALLLLIFVRPKIFSYSRLQWKTALLLGAAMSIINICFYQSLLSLPIGIATSIEFLGPLSVSAFYLVRIHRWQILWPIFAAVGVMLLTIGKSSADSLFALLAAVDAIGLTFAFAAAFGWGSYVILMKKTGRVFLGLEGLAMSLAAAAVISSPFGLFGAGGSISFESARAAFGLAILVPLIPYILEMLALRKMHERVFSILMSVEPVISVIIGWIVLSQSLTVAQVAGVAFVTIAMAKVTQRKPSDV